MSNIVIPLANRLRDIRQECGLSVPEVVEMSGGTISPSYMHMIESGKIVNPGIDRIIQLAQLYEISLDELVGLPSRVRDLNTQEVDLLRVFRRLTVRDRVTAFEIAKVFVRLHRQRTKPK